MMAGLLACGLSACGEQGEVYPMPASRVASRLHGMILPAELGFGRDGLSGASLEASSDQAVTWRITDGGRTLGWMDAKLDAIDLDHTRVAVDFRPGPSIGGGGGEALGAIGQAVFGEAVDAELDGRAYSRGRAQAALAGYALTHRSEMMAFVDDDQFRRDFEHPSDEMRDQVMAAEAAHNPEIAVHERERETQRKMEAASAPNLKLGSTDTDD